MHRHRYRRSVITLAALSGLAGSSAAFGYIGSCAPADGYLLSGIGPFPADWVDVTYYNAGAFGANAGGGSVTPVIPDSGRWSLLSQVGGFFTSSAARAASVGGAPPYPNAIPSNTVPAYMVGNHFPGRGGDGSNLAFRNDTPIGTGAAKYDYSIDTFDTGGITPSTVTSGVVSAGMYFCPNPSDPTQPGTHPLDKFTLSLKDSGGNIGLQWGYARDNEVYWRSGSTGSWNYTGVYANASNWDGFNISIDLTAQTFKIDYYIVSSNTWINLAPAGTALGATMSNLTNLGWQLEDGVTSGIGGKNFFDDAYFSIPAPGASALIMLGGAFAGRRRR